MKVFGRSEITDIVYIFHKTEMRPLAGGLIS